MLVISILSVLIAAVLIYNPVWPQWQFLGGGAIGTPLFPIRSTSTDQVYNQYVFGGAAYFAIFLFSQYLFLCPRGRWRIAASTDGPASRRSLMAAAFIGMLLSVGLIATVMEIPNWWLELTTEEGLNTPQRFAIIWVVMGVLWLTWFLVFYSYFGSLDRYNALQRVFRWLLAGTLLETLVAGPVHAWVIHERGDECYCQRGSWTGVAFGCTAAFWLFGPGTLLLFMREKKRREELI